MYSLRRSCRTALLDSNHVLVLANGSRRAFSRSAVHFRGALPVYLEASSPELSQLLSSLNSKVLLPRHLTPEQQKLVYKPANRSKLEQEPVEITLGDVTLTLQHIDRTKDVPSYTTQLQKIVRASKTPEDWENVVRVLEGYASANIRLRNNTLTMAVRRLDEAGMQHLILKAIQRAEATGLRLREPDLIFMVMRSVRDRAWQNDWDKDELKKALRMAEQIVELMDDPVHLGKPAADGPDYRTHPAVVALPLEMAAELAYRHDGPSDAVKKYTPRFMNALKQHDFMASEITELDSLTAKLSSDFRTRFAQTSALPDILNKATALVPVWNALSVSRTVLDAEMPMADDAARVQRQLRDILGKAVDALERLRIRDGEELTSGAETGYVGYLKRAIRVCEEEED